MFNTQSTGYSLSDIAAVTNGRSGGYGEEGFGGSAWWIIILFLFVFCGWGNNGWGNGQNSGAQGAIIRSDLCSEFSFNGLNRAVGGISDGICSLGYDQLAQMNGINSNLASGFAGVNNAICTLGYQNADLINGVNVAMMQGQNALQTQLADCCCKTQNSIRDVSYQMATDTCAVNTNVSNNTRDIIESQNANTRAILEAINQGKIDAMQDKIATLTAENSKLAFAASQTAQNNYLVDQLRPCPVPAYLVCGGNTYNGGYPGYSPVTFNTCSCA